MADGQDDGSAPPMWDRPMHEQISVLRHDLAGVQQGLLLLRDSDVRQMGCIENIEKRLTVITQQIIGTTPENIARMVAQVIDEKEARRRQTEDDREQRRLRQMQIVGILVGIFVGICTMLSPFLLSKF